MPTGKASALLQKVNSQLRGERVPLKSKEEDELANYLSSLTQKTQAAQKTSFEDFGDISISSGKDGPAKEWTPTKSKAAAPVSKFLKKKKPVVEEEEDDDDEPLQLRGSSTSGQGLVIAGSGRDKGFPEKSTALNKFNALSNKIHKRQSNGLRRVASRDSDSESDFGVRPGSADTSIGRDGRKFLKGRQSLEDPQLERGSPSPPPGPRKSSAEKKKSSKKGSATAQGEIKRTLGNVYLTSEEESLAEFIHGLSVSEASVKRPTNLVAKKQQKWRKKSQSQQSPSHVARSPSPSPFKRSPSPFGARLSRSASQQDGDSDVVDSMASEIMDIPLRGGRAGDSLSSDDPLNINLMDVGNLIPLSPRNNSQSSKKSKKDKQAKKKLKKTKSSSSIFKASSGSDTPAKKTMDKKAGNKKTLKRENSQSSVLESLGIHMVDELLEVRLEGSQRDAGDDSDGSEILTEHSDHIGRRRMTDSESEIVTMLGDRKPQPRMVSLNDTNTSISEHFTKKSEKQSRQYSSYEEDDDYTEDDEEDYSESFESATLSVSQSETQSRGRARHRRKNSNTASHSVGGAAGRRRRVVVEQTEAAVAAPGQAWAGTSTQVHVDGPWGLGYVDPAPIATRLVSADALEAMTSYSPSVLALQDMLRAQLELVANFSEVQKRIYQNCEAGLKEDFQYTTLEDTKEYIRQHRSPAMTLQDALKLVDMEDGITT